MKKISIIFVVGLILIVCFLVIQTKNENKISKNNELSDRAKQYLANKKETDDSSWRNVEVNTKKRSNGESSEDFNADNCFSFVVPFPISNINQKGECSYSILVDSPRGRVVIFKRNVSVSHLDEVADIIMRKNNKAAYQQNSIKAKNNEFMTFKKTDIQTYEKSAFMLKDGMIAITLIASTNENLDDKFAKMIDSVEIK